MIKESHVSIRFNDLAGIYDRRWRGYLEDTFAFLKSQLSLTGSEVILDVACGTGALEQILVSRHPSQKIAGVDISEEMLSVAKQKFASHPNITFYKASALRLPFENNHFDLVVCANSFHYFDKPEVCLVEMTRVLKRGRKLIIMDWCKDYLTCRICDLCLKVIDPAHHQCYRLTELLGLLEQAGLQIISSKKARLRVVWGMMLVEALKP